MKFEGPEPAVDPEPEAVNRDRKPEIGFRVLLAKPFYNAQESRLLQWRCPGLGIQSFG